VFDPLGFGLSPVASDRNRRKRSVGDRLVITSQRAPFATADSVGPLACAEELRRTAYREPRWYAAYTRAHHERKAHEQFLRRSIDSFLPTYASVRRWKDRRVRLEMPLFPSYVFVHIPFAERLRVLEVPSVVRMVGFGGVPVALNEEEVECLRRALTQGTIARPHPYLTAGRRVRVIGGPLQGAEGTLVKRKGNFRVILSVNLIKQSVVVDVSEADLEPLFCSPATSKTPEMANPSH
jgi:transcription antitermination factor NusG